jgi:ribosomal protein S18 acetylase RimI-like enzyme
MPDAVRLRGAGENDLPFLFDLYCDVRATEVNAWGWPAAQQDAFLRMQFEAQRRSYQAAYPEAANQIIEAGNVAIGRVFTARAADGMQLVDIALDAAFRNRGIGTRLIQQLMDDCKKKRLVLRLHVFRGNPAFNLYQRLGFRETGGDQMYIQMAWEPAVVRSA